MAPENTLAAFRGGAALGYRMFECDVRLSADGLPFLLHDDTLTRTTNAPDVLGQGLSALAADHPWGTLALLDAGSWHSRCFTGEPLATLEAIARYCLQNRYALNIELKPSPGTDQETGSVVARHAARLWHAAPMPPLLSSFSLPALQAARLAQPELPRALLLEAMDDDWLQSALKLGCVAVVAHHPLWNEERMTQAQAAGLRTLSYTVNEPAEVQRLDQLGLDAFITDRVDLFSPAS
jgi:glycerophosphoryl diester phosphodiesterase